MVRFHERLLADPGDAFAAHLGRVVDVAVHPVGHEVAADAAEGAAAFRHLRRRVVGAPGAEVGQPGHVEWRAIRRFLCRAVKEGNAGSHALAVVQRGESPGNDTRDPVGIEIADRLDQDFAIFFVAPDDAGPSVFRQPVADPP